MEDNTKVFIAKADIDIESLLADIEDVHRPDRMLDLRIAAVTGVYDHYALDLGREPSSVSLSFNDYYDCVNVRVSNSRGGGLEYSDRLPKFTESLDATYAVAQVLTGQGRPTMTLQFPASDGMGAIAKLGTTWHTISGTGKNPCLAMCSALVRYAHGLQLGKSLEAQLRESVESSPKMR